MRSKIIAWPVIPGNDESELNFAHLWNYGNMIAHYTPSGDAAHHRLFSNLREMPYVLTPIGIILDVVGMDIANGIALNAVLRPTANVTVDGAITTSVNGTVTTTTP